MRTLIQHFIQSTSTSPRHFVQDDRPAISRVLILLHPPLLSPQSSSSSPRPALHCSPPPTRLHPVAVSSPTTLQPIAVLSPTLQPVAPHARENPRQSFKNAIAHPIAGLLNQTINAAPQCTRHTAWNFPNPSPSVLTIPDRDGHGTPHLPRLRSRRLALGDQSPHRTHAQHQHPTPEGRRRGNRGRRGLRRHADGEEVSRETIAAIAGFVDA